MKFFHRSNCMRSLFVALSLSQSWALATDVPRLPVSEVSPLLRQALQSSDGTANGILVGELAQAIGLRFQSPSPIHIDVRTERRYVQAGCARLHVLFRHDGVLLPGAADARGQSIEFGIDYCLTGEPPGSRQ
ncbi:hypothetical protein O4H66_15355 [Comamonadaceae bacterium G21597-S1]|nr:hypothetical protein [Comamonadaceae bacterium G21597-S1]